MTSIRKICITAIMIALCSILPVMFHLVGMGSTFAPMHIPVLLCGLICGSFYGLCCGIIGPIISSLLTGMPGPMILVSMVPELITYGVVTGLMMKRVHTRRLSIDLYLSLIIAMLAGRIVAGIAKALLYMGTGEAFSFSIWISSHFVTALPGIVCHLVLIPILMMALYKAKLIPSQYNPQNA